MSSSLEWTTRTPSYFHLGLRSLIASLRFARLEERRAHAVEACEAEHDEQRVLRAEPGIRSACRIR